MDAPLPASNAQPTARWHYERGRSLYQAGQYRKAATAFRRAIRRAPGMPLAYMGRGLSLARLNRHQRAAVNIEKALALAAESGHFTDAAWLAQTAYEGARTYERLGRHYMALRLYTKAIETAPEVQSADTMATLLRQRGRVHLRLNHYQAALTDLDRALSAAPDQAPTYLSRAAAYEALDCADEAVADLNRFLELADSDDPRRERVQSRLADLSAPQES